MYDIKSCSDLAKNGIVESGEFDLDLIQDHKPVKAWCNLPSGETILGQNTTIEIEHCTGSSCIQEDLTYDNALEEIVALLNSSSNLLFFVNGYYYRGPPLTWFPLLRFLAYVCSSGGFSC